MVAVALGTDDGSRSLTFTATAPSALRAAAAANAHSEAFVTLRERRNATQYKAAIENLRDAIAEVDKRLADLNDADGNDPRRGPLERQREPFQTTLDRLELSAIISGSTGVQITSAAVPPSDRAGPSITRYTALALIAGILVGIGVVGLAEFFDHTVRGGDSARAASNGVPVIGAVRTGVRRWPPLIGPRPATGVVLLDAPWSMEAESFRRLRATLTSGDSQPTRFLQVSSAAAEDGAGSLAANISTALAQAGHETVLVCLAGTEMHLPVPTQRASSVAGLQAVLAGRAAIEDCLERVPSLRQLGVMSSSAEGGDPDILARPAAASLFDELCARFSFVVVLAPPILRSSLALEMARFADGTVLAVKPGATNTADLERVTESLALVDARAVGLVLVN